MPWAHGVHGSLLPGPRVVSLPSQGGEQHTLVPPPPTVAHDLFKPPVLMDRRAGERPGGTPTRVFEKTCFPLTFVSVVLILNVFSCCTG